jgi:hypothetical protein
VYVLEVSLPSQESGLVMIPLTHKYMTAHSPGLVMIPLTHKYMTAHFPGLVMIPLTHKYMTAHSPVYVLGVSLPSQESEQSCVCVRGIVTKPGE